MGNVRLIYRSIFVILVLLAGMLLTPLLQNGRLQREGLTAMTNMRWHGWLARALGIRITVVGKPTDSAALYVANHISWFDISALGSQIPLRFLSKDEVRHWPVIGWLASRAGTLYIKRGAHASQEAISAMAGALVRNQNVCLFPEGTTTDGNLRRFHGRLIQSAIDAGVRVQPVVLYYPPQRFDDGSKAHHDIQYIGDTSLAESLLWILRSNSISARLYILPAADTEERSRDELTSYCEEQIRSRIESLYDQDADRR